MEVVASASRRSDRKSDQKRLVPVAPPSHFPCPLSPSKITNRYFGVLPDLFHSRRDTSAKCFLPLVDISRVQSGQGSRLLVVLKRAFESWNFLSHPSKLDTIQDYRPSHSPHGRTRLGLATRPAAGRNVDINTSYQTPRTPISARSGADLNESRVNGRIGRRLFSRGCGCETRLSARQYPG